MPKTPYRQVHPYAELFPMMDDDSYAVLKDDIRKNRLSEPGMLTKDGRILDGRNRYKACRELDHEMRWDVCDEGDELASVISRNLHRRHLTTSQRSMVAARMASMKSGTRTDLGSNDTRSIDETAKLLKVGRASVARAKAVIDKGCSELVAAVDAGKVSIALAEKFVKAVSDEKQAGIVANGKAAIKEHMAPPKPEQEPNEADDYDHRLVEAFRDCDYRVNTLKRVFEMLDPGEVEGVRGWFEEAVQ